MNQGPITLGMRIAELRKRMNLSQKQLAERLHREDGAPITPQYLNDIERDRRVPPDHLIIQIAQVLNTDPEHLTLLAGRVPPTVLKRLASEEQFTAFRKGKN